MPQYDFGTINPATTTGSDLASVLQNWRDAVLSNHSGTSRPTYIKAGQIWVNTSTATGWVINLYDGATDIPLGYVNATDDAAGFLTRSIVTTKTATATILVGERNMIVGVTASTTNIALTLPVATSAKNGFAIKFQKRDNTAFTVTITRGGSDLINGATSYVLSQQYDTVELVCDGVNAWYAYGGILDNSITTPKIADNAITTAKIANNAITSAKLDAGLNQFFVPTGVIAPFAGTSAPTGWALCAGQAVSRTTFAALFAVINTTWGAGDGSTTFNLPDFRGRVPAGLDNMGGISAGRLRSTRAIGVTTIGQSGTTITVTCSGAHGLDAGDVVTITGAGNAAFNGTWTIASIRINSLDATRASQVFFITAAASATITAVAGGTITTTIPGSVDGSVLGAAGGADAVALSVAELPNHTHYGSNAGESQGYGVMFDYSASDASYSGSGTDKSANSWTGGNAPHNNIQPTIVCNYIIKV